MAPSVWGRRPRFHVPPGAVLITILVLIAAAAALTRLGPPSAPLTGHAEAIDGDTLRLGATRIRLVGLDAPELDQTCTRTDGSEWACGRDARTFLVGRLKQEPVECTRAGRDIYGRTLAKCSVEDDDIGAAIVRAGWAVSNDDYLADAFDARAQQLGIWSGSFDQPADWRRTHGTERSGVWEWIRSWFQ